VTGNRFARNEIEGPARRLSGALVEHSQAFGDDAEVARGLETHFDASKALAMRS
jgi:hypothetical protein